MRPDWERINLHLVSIGRIRKQSFLKANFLGFQYTFQMSQNFDWTLWWHGCLQTERSLVQSKLSAILFSSSIKFGSFECSMEHKELCYLLEGIVWGQKLFQYQVKIVTRHFLKYLSDLEAMQQLFSLHAKVALAGSCVIKKRPRLRRFHPVYLKAKIAWPIFETRQLTDLLDITV